MDPNQRFLLVHVILLQWWVYYFCMYQSSIIPNSGTENDRIALLAFRDGITNDPFGAVQSWNDSFHFCSWRGITCSHRLQRVTVLDLQSEKLEGSISPYIGNLTFLNNLDLRNNNFNGEIPQEIGRLIRLQRLNLSENLLRGEIPINLTNCLELRFLYAMKNQLVGRIPTELGSLGNLIGLGLTGNHLSGTIPASLSNLSSLTHLSLMDNNLRGNIPWELGKLSRLEFLQMAGNNLSGSIPPQLFNISSIYFFVVTENQFHGTIPHNIGHTLPNLQYLLLAKNRFYGLLPNSISNASRLVRLGLSTNQFTGRIPPSLGNLQDLIRLNLGRNQLGTGENDDLIFLNSLTNCSRLEVLALNENNLTGRLPDSIANLSAKLNYLYIGANHISGKIPTGIQNLVSLTSIAMEENLLTGSIPASLGKLPNLLVVSMFGNQFSGQIPSTICNNSQLLEIHFNNNRLQGRIPPTLGNCHKLQILSISQNQLVGTIPKSVIGLSNLSNYLDLSQNQLTGNLPSEVGNLKSILYLYISDNKLSGEIPSALENCLGLLQLCLDGNFFEGIIPPSLKSLKGIEELDLSRNNLTGQIPEYLESFVSLKILNLSFNDFEGEVPKVGIFRNSSSFSVLGNNKLCGGITKLHLPSCSNPSLKKHRKQFSIKSILLIIGAVTCSIVLVSFIIFFWRRKAREAKQEPSYSKSSSEDMFEKVSYKELRKATDEFSPENLVGVGSYGSVYKAVLGQETEKVVAVKVLDLQRRGASKSFMAECEVLRCIRHRNLVKVLTSCSSLDFKGNEFKALVFEFMPNGNLEDWLHPAANGQFQGRRSLSFTERLNVAIDVASALNYLHHHCHRQIAHCDLKPSNVLLDNEMNAHVGDFGLATFLSGFIDGASEFNTSSVAIKGTVGYVAPEYGLGGALLTSGDVYSYGIMLLEIFTGMRPTDDIFKDGLCLHSFAKTALPDRVMHIVDPALLHQDEDDNDEKALIIRDTSEINAKMCERLIRIVRVGVICSTESPKERLDMAQVLNELQSIRGMSLVS